MIVERAASNEHELLKQDFYNSLLAAFTLEEVKQQLMDAGLFHFSVSIVSERHLCCFIIGAWYGILTASLIGCTFKSLNKCLII